MDDTQNKMPEPAQPGVYTPPVEQVVPVTPEPQAPVEPAVPPMQEPTIVPNQGSQVPPVILP